jgi:N utilization substance protein A
MEMAKRTKKSAKAEEDYGKEFFAALDQIEQEKGIKKSYMLEKITQALTSAYKRDHEGVGDNLVVLTDEEKGTVRMVIRRDVVEEVDNPNTEISLEDAKRYLPTVQLGDVVSSEIKTRNFGRIAAQTARQVIIQGIREAERSMVYDEFTSKNQEILTGVVHRVDPNTGALFLRLGSGSETTEALLTAGEQVPGEHYVEGDRLKVYVVDVRRSAKGPQVLISRTHYGLVKRLFEMEVPEIYDGVVEIKSIAREAGSRTKMAVASNDPAVDPIGACVGNRGARVTTIVNELKGEKVDIIKYSDDPETYIASALSPADVVSVTVLDEGKSCRVVVPDDQLSLAIGKEGQNARLAAKLTGYKIDIKSVTAAAQAEEELTEDDLLAVDEDELIADEAESTEETAEESAEEAVEETEAPVEEAVTEE